MKSLNHGRLRLGLYLKPFNSLPYLKEVVEQQILEDKRDLEVWRQPFLGFQSLQGLLKRSASTNLA